MVVLHFLVYIWHVHFCLHNGLNASRIWTYTSTIYWRSRPRSDLRWFALCCLWLDGGEVRSPSCFASALILKQTPYWLYRFFKTHVGHEVISSPYWKLYSHPTTII